MLDTLHASHTRSIRPTSADIPRQVIDSTEDDHVLSWLVAVEDEEEAMIDQMILAGLVTP